MAGLCEGGSEPQGSVKVLSKRCFIPPQSLVVFVSVTLKAILIRLLWLRLAWRRTQRTEDSKGASAVNLRLSGVKQASSCTLYGDSSVDDEEMGVARCAVYVASQRDLAASPGTDLSNRISAKLQQIALDLEQGWALGANSISKALIFLNRRMRCARPASHKSGPQYKKNQ
ncbi:hypothetical protein ANN_09455 [Periplaneta americana]|uniref:Uncharacterized protein n=1 Tax=Periplaneta americana TaxID=6978 RepID=A0ABQ8TLD5_PERAM|nr:hypothetical protein ANN_09455 [Periplaneta americana]